MQSLTEFIEKRYGEGITIQSRDRVYGGDINDAVRITLSNREMLFLKKNEARHLDLFEKEERGLDFLRESGILGVPKTYGTGIEGNCAFLVMEYIESAPKRKDYWEVFGRELAMLHRWQGSSYAKGRYGFPEDDHIGKTPQKNDWRDRWADFYRNCRIRPQRDMAEKLLDRSDLKKLDYLLDHMEEYLTEPERSSVLHGDLWSGNVICGRDGKAWLIDPAAYLGDRETDLAMTELFGGFPPVFYQAYQEEYPLEPGYRDRKNLYQLYHLLNHLNLFGGSYLWDVREILTFYVGGKC